MKNDKIIFISDLDPAHANALIVAFNYYYDANGKSKHLYGYDYAELRQAFYALDTFIINFNLQVFTNQIPLTISDLQAILDMIVNCMNYFTVGMGSRAMQSYNLLLLGYQAIKSIMVIIFELQD